MENFDGGIKLANNVSISSRLFQIARQYSEALQRRLGDRLITIALFGSVARKEATPFSDIDLLLIIKGLPRGRFARMDLLEPVNDEIDPNLEKLREENIFSDFCPVLKTPEEAKKPTPLYLDMVEDLQILYDRGNFFSDILNRLKDSLKKLGARPTKAGNFSPLGIETRLYARRNVRDMTNLEIAWSYLKQCKEIYKEAESFRRRGVWHLAVRRSQEAVEMALKGALRYVGIEVPGIHDVGILLRRHKGKFPDNFGQEVDHFSSISRRLRKERETSFYGDEESGTPSDELYIEEDAEIALKDAALILKAFEELFFFPKPGKSG
jgi:HEPN domain-containing protein/predicted nucleotidyltransferase